MWVSPDQLPGSRESRVGRKLFSMTTFDLREQPIRVVDVLDLLAQMPIPTNSADDELFDDIQRWVQLRNLADARLVEAVAEIERSGLARRQGRRPAELLVAAGLVPVAAARTTAVAARIAGLPRVRASLADARISSEVAATLCSGMAVIERRSGGLDDAARDQRESELMGHAHSGASPAQLRDKATEIANSLAPATPDSPERGLHPSADRTANELSVTRNDDGRFTVAGNLDAVIGTQVSATLNALASARPEPDGSPDGRSKPQRMADALHLMASTGNSKSDNGVGSVVAPRLSIVLDADTPYTPRVPSVGHVDEIVAQVAACDALAESVTVDTNGVPLSMGRTVRTFTAAQKRALEIRDRGCIKCGAPASMTDAHHVDWWERDHGHTDVDAGCLLCRCCHAEVHLEKWDIYIGADRHPWLIPPATVDATRTPQKSHHRRTLTLAA